MKIKSIVLAVVLFVSAIAFAQQGTSVQTLHGSASGAPTWKQVEITTEALMNGAAITPTVNDGFYFAPASNCSISQASGTETVASVLKVSGNIQVIQETTTTTTATHTVICAVTVPTKLTAGHGVTINDVTLLYGNSTGTIATCNAPTVGTQTAPTAGTSETAASATLVTAGAVTVTPVVGSCNTTAVSAGQVYSEKIALTTPLALNTDMTTLYVTQSFVGPTNATFTLNIAGLDVHYTNVPL